MKSQNIGVGIALISTFFIGTLFEKSRESRDSISIETQFQVLKKLDNEIGDLVENIEKLREQLLNIRHRSRIAFLNEYSLTVNRKQMLSDEDLRIFLKKLNEEKLLLEEKLKLQEPFPEDKRE